MSARLLMIRPLPAVETFIQAARQEGRNVWVHRLNKGGLEAIMRDGELLATEGVTGFGGMEKARAVHIEQALQPGDGRYPRLWEHTDLDEVIVFTVKQEDEVRKGYGYCYPTIPPYIRCKFHRALFLTPTGEFLKYYPDATLL